MLVLDRYRAVSDYKKSQRGEVTLQRGATYEVVEKNDNGWWFVQCETMDEQGWAPATFLEPIDDPKEEKHASPVPQEEEKYITITAYKAENDDEVGFDKGVLVKVLEKSLDGWWRVSYAGKTGWAPGSYLEKMRVQQYEPSGLLEHAPE